MNKSTIMDKLSDMLDNDKFELKIADATAKEFLNTNDGVALYVKTKNAFVYGDYKEE